MVGYGLTLDCEASYLSNLEKPVKRNRACYEDWLGRYLITKESKT